VVILGFLEGQGRAKRGVGAMVNGRRFVILVACGLGLVWYMGLGSDKRIELIKTIKAKAPTAILRHSEPAQNISVLTFPKVSPSDGVTPGAGVMGWS